MLRNKHLSDILEIVKNSSIEVLEFMFREAIEGFWIQRSDTHEDRFFSPQILNLLGYGSGNISAFTESIIDPSDWLSFKSDLTKKNQEVWSKIVLKYKNGDKRSFEANCLSFTDKTNTGYELYCIRNLQETEAKRDLFQKNNIWKILDLLPATIGFWDQNLINRYANEAYSSWFGKKPSEIVGKHISELLSEETYNLNKPFLEKVLLGETQIFERELLNLDQKSKKTSLANYIPSFGKDGSVEGFIAFVTDITSVKVAQRKAERSEAELRILLNSLPVGVTILDESIQIIEMNPKLEEILNLPKERILAGEYKKYKFLTHDSKLFPNEDLPSIRCVREKKVISNVIIGLAIENLPTKWLNVTAVPLSLPGFAALTITNDITELKAHEVLSKQLVTIVDSSADAIYGMNSDGKIITWNKGAESLFGYLKEEVIGQSCEILIPPEKLDEEARIAEKCARGESILQYETYRLAKNGDLLDISMSISPIFNSQGKNDGMSVVARDIHEQRFIQEEQKRAKNLAEQASLAKSDFLANMSHEIRTPLNGIIGFTDLLLKTSLDYTQKDYMRTIYQSANSLLDIVSDILDFSKIEAGKLELVPELTSLGDLADEVINIVRYQANQKQVKLRLNIVPDLPDYVMIDPARLKQIIINLISNAIKFTDKGKIEFSISILQVLDDDWMKIRISIQDTGIGIAKQNQSKIFEAFTQEDFSTTRRFGGTGLGLSISNKILGLMNSKIQLNSELGKGSDFFFDLELQTSNSSLLDFKPEVSLQDSNLKKPLIVNEKYSILIAEDNEVNMMLVKAIMKKILPNSIFHEAKNGMEAIHQVQNSIPDMIFMDIQMPIVNGYEATKQIREMVGVSEIPIVAVTAGTVLGEKERCLEAGMNDYISKPATRADFEKMIHVWLIKG